MPQGVLNDLYDITFYNSVTPVYYTSSNLPLADLNNNVLILDQKLNAWLVTGTNPESHAGDGTFTTPITFPFTMNTTPRLQVSTSDESALALGKLYVTTANITTIGFDLIVKATGTGGAWTCTSQYFADGR